MTDEEPAGPPAPARPSRRKPPVWPALVAFVAAAALSVGGQFAAGVLIGVWYVATGGDVRRLPADLPDLLTSTPVFVALVLVSQAALLATALVAARVAPPRGGLGLARPALPVWAYPALAVGSLVPALVGAGAAEAVSWAVPADPTVERVFGRVTPRAAVPFVLFIALVPGFVEEVFFRGYVQRRLLAKWPAWAAVVVAAGLFALVHVDPASVAFAFVVGVWLGAVAWRAGSVWAAALCHASVNAASGVWALGTRYGAVPDPLPDAAAGAGVAVALGCFLASVWALRRARPRAGAAAPDG